MTTATTIMKQMMTKSKMILPNMKRLSTLPPPTLPRCSRRVLQPPLKYHGMPWGMLSLSSLSQKMVDTSSLHHACQQETTTSWSLSLPMSVLTWGLSHGKIPNGKWWNFKKGPMRPRPPMKTMNTTFPWASKSLNWPRENFEWYWHRPMDHSPYFHFRMKMIHKALSWRCHP